MTINRVAVLACTNVIGGHEFQAVALSGSLAEHAAVTVFVNRLEHAKLFEDKGLEVRLAVDILLRPGVLPWQVLDGWCRRNAIRSIVAEFDFVIVSAGTVEAGVAAGVALRGYKPTMMYLPSFYDRVIVWGWKGHLYNCLLGTACKLFDRIITINKIQARVIRVFSGIQTLVVANRIRQVQLPTEEGPARLVFVGRLDQQKRIDELMRWLDTSSNLVKDLLIIGEGPMRPKLAQLAQNLTHLKCSFVGWASPEEQDRLIRTSDILVLNSLIEGEPLVIREARARGMHIVARDIPGTRGITSRQERFCSQPELLDRINTFTLRPKLPAKERISANQKRSCDLKRKQQITTLLRVMNSATRINL